MGPAISCNEAGYYDVVGNIGNALVGLGALIAAYQYALPLIAYLYYSEDLQNEDVWYEYINIKTSEPGKISTIHNVFNDSDYGRPMWWNPICQIADIAFHRMDGSRLKSKGLDAHFQKYKDLFEKIAQHVAMNSVYDRPDYRNIEEVNVLMVELRKQYNLITKEINKNKVPQWIRDLLESKYHKKPKTVISEI